MLVYWGGFHGAKKYVKKLLQYNNKPYCMMYDYIITHDTGKCHWIKKRHHELIWDRTLEMDIIHRFKNTSELHRARIVKRNVEHVGLTLKGLLKDKTFKVLDPTSDHTIEDMYDSDGEKTDLGIMLEKNKDGKLDKVTLDDVPECPILFPHQTQSNYAFDGVDISERYSEHVNVVPFKSDLVESCRNQSYFIDFIFLYKNNKRKLWGQLDKNVFEENYKIAEKLHQANIKFEYFDLDKGDFTKRFQVKKMLSRHITHPSIVQLKTLKDKKTARENYKTITNIAKEYLSTKNRKDNRL
tara:strand:+ start:1211 stop:2101 length:891 start_codon:yes stop_codon:yes gene_type:complete